MNAQGRGLFQKIKPNGVWYVRKAIPKAVRSRFGGKLELIKSLGTNDFRTAERLAADVWRGWDLEIAHAKQFAGQATLERAEAVAAFEAWRRQRCADAVGEVGPSATQLNEQRDGELLVALPSQRLARAGVLYRTRTSESAAPLRIDVEGVALAYFDQHPEASRDLTMPWAIGIRIGRLQAATRDISIWRDIEGFDQALNDALAAGGAVGALSPGLREELRATFAATWLEVCRHEEAARQRAAAFLYAVQAAKTSADTIMVDTSRTSYQPREGDRTVKELITAFRADRSAAYGEESTERKYAHIFTALEDALTADKPLRAVTRDDARKVRDLLRAIPAHMGKRYPGFSLEEAIDKAAEEEAPLLAPNTVNSYLSNLTAMFNWAVREDWLETSPATSLTLKNLPNLKRRGFAEAELKRIFDALKQEREDDSWRFWIPALGLYTGARLNEICQLKVDDLRVEGEIWYLTFTLFDTTGRRDKNKRLKTADSARNVPLHPELVTAGFPKLLKNLKSKRVFSELKAGPSGSFSHDVSKWFGAFLDRIGLTDPALVYHSFRHGFRDACDVAAIPDSLTRALGGWAADNVSDKYGRRDIVPVLYRELERLSYGNFSLS